ncbi:phage tail domain-containing protein [Weissella tructae]|uniref:phage tail domain-containing protein n=1 Tax=Weissella tructae TaxID=887702 RepID=UPI003D9234D1
MAEKVKITYRNTNGDELIMGRFAPFYILGYNGFGMPDNTIDTQELYGMSGARKITSSLNVRDIELVLLIKADNFEELKDLKRSVLKVLNPAFAGTLIYQVLDKTYEIDVEIVQGFDAQEQTSLSEKSAIQFKALDPFWRDLSDYENLVPLNEVKPLFKFPLQITPDFKFAEMNPGEIVTIRNDGDANVGAVFTLKFTKKVVNPRVFDIRKQTFFGFKKTFYAGDTVTFSTVRNKKRVTFKAKDGQNVNAMGMRMQGSTFITLNIGETYLQIQADEGIDGVLGTLDYSPLVLGV